MKKSLLIVAVGIATAAISTHRLEACTGITLTAPDGSRTILARTVEWGGSDMESRYVIVPRGHQQRSFTPEGVNGMAFSASYGYVGLAVEQDEFVIEGLNEEGLSAGLFYFPNYGRYGDYDPTRRAASIADLQLVSLVLGSCKTVEDVKKLVGEVRVIAIDPRASTVHWRFADTTGRQIVLEIIDGNPIFYENELGVLTNSPSFDWQLTNLNNYVNLRTGSAAGQKLGALTLSQFGSGGGMLGLPGDITPPSRFVRAAFFQASAPRQDSRLKTVLQCFQILNNFDIPIGIEFPIGEVPVDIPSATQWTSASDLTSRTIYFRTMYDSTIRSISLGEIDFARVPFQSSLLDVSRQQPIVPITIKFD